LTSIQEEDTIGVVLFGFLGEREIQAVRLTRRQRAFLAKLSEIYSETGRPVHYSNVAEELGVNRFSAYDMLRLLEEKGVVASEYVLDGENPGPGRSMIVFYPTARASEALGQSEWDLRLLEDWLQRKESLLARLREASEAGYGDILNELLSKIPERTVPLTVCTEAVAALLLNLKGIREEAAERRLVRALQDIDAIGESGLGALAGLSLGSSLSEAGESSRSFTEKLLACARDYQTSLEDMSEENKKKLLDFVREVIRIFGLEPA
jgi:hypothetical protein